MGQFLGLGSTERQPPPPAPPAQLPDAPLAQLPDPKPARGGCVICLEHDSACYAAVPCGHQVVCNTCMHSLGAGAPCPLCRIPVRQFIQIFVVELGRDEELRLARQQAIDAEKTVSEQRCLALEADRLRLEQAEARLAAEIAKTEAAREAAEAVWAIVRAAQTRESIAISEAASAVEEQTAARIVAEAARAEAERRLEQARDTAEVARAMHEHAVANSASASSSATVAAGFPSVHSRPVASPRSGIKRHRKDKEGDDGNMVVEDSAPGRRRRR